ncbi:unnamed protein product [Paramecium octaurelia]|uniref:Insulin-like growth factor binding protein, N-terminal n=1 Tax=Paramecium octaurelia TaxID=43137 RepID=A0A8S1UDF5_PAROT|nr:unnamed protein product [Paramecium octaurelia]
MNRQMFHLTLFLLLNYANCFQHSIYEEFNTKKINLTNTNWKCEVSTTTIPSEVFTCSKGMDLMVIKQQGQTCNQMQNQIDTKLPHYKIQLYIDVYGYHSIDDSESIQVSILDNIYTRSLRLYPYQGQQLKQCNNYTGNLIRQSIFTELNHSHEQVNLQIKSTANSEFADESYLFRNVQLILDRCYKTCKTCSGDGKQECLTCYNNIALSASNTCDSCKNQNNQNFLQIPIGCQSQCDDNQDYDEDQVCIEKIKPQEKCQVDCQQCTNTQSCLICKPQKYLYFGQCMDQCPEYTIVQGTNCLSNIETILKMNNLRITQLFKQFHDLSTTKMTIQEHFSVISLNNSFDFKKGSDIYYSYFGSKRIFGGPLVWVNAKFKFTQSWIQEFRIIRIFFEIILGDVEFNKAKFTYKLNDQQLESITLTQNYSGSNPNIEDQIWPNNYLFNIYKVDKTLKYFISTNKQLTMEIECQNSNSLGFCGIQNMVVFGDFECEPEYNFDFFNHETGRNPFIPICGDKIVVGDEECDDGNNYPFDGCFNCRYQCEEHCDNCVYGYCISKNFKQKAIQIQGDSVEYKFAYNFLDSIQLSCIFQCDICINNLCLQCSYGYYLNTINNLCETFCGDSIQQGNEQCDDGNTDNYDGCSLCELIQYDKCDKGLDIEKYHCTYCYQGKCLKCIDGFLLDGDICISVCGDGLLNLMEEECDVQAGDGCRDCKIQDGYVCGKLDFSICQTCDIQCAQCVSLDKINLICKSCIDGYFPVDEKCQLCDSNCITCQQQSNLCTSCYRSDCDFCESTPGLFGNTKTKSCDSICGDGILVELYEQCDDQNQDNGDGCDSQCNLEFSDNDLNQMKFYQEFANNTYDLKLVPQYQLQILCNSAKITIDNMEISDYNYNCTQIDDLTCKLQFDFKKSIYQSNTIHALLQFTNQMKRLLVENDRILQFDITPTEYIILNQNDEEQQEQIQSAQQSFNSFFLIMIPVSIIFNLFNYLWAVLEILSWINNFYFLNVNYPFNVELFFLNSNWSSFINFPTYQGLNQPDSSYYFEAPKRFMNKGIDPLFFNNIQIPLMFIFSSILIFLINYLLYSFFSLLDDALKLKISLKDKHISVFNIQIKKQPHQNAIKEQEQMVVQNKYLKYITNFFKSNSTHLINQFKSTISLCLLDITLAIFLQLLYSKNNSHIIVGSNQFLAIMAIGIIIFQCYQQYQILNIHQLKAKNKHFEQKFGIYYENINLENSFGYYYSFFEQISKILYIFFMVFYYYTPLLQVTLCYLSSSLCFVFLLYQNPFNSKKEYVRELLSNFCLGSILFIIISFAVNDQIQFEFIEQNKIILGWMIIALVLVAIANEFCILGFGLILQFFNFFQILRNLIKKKSQNNGDQLNEQQSEQKETKNIHNTKGNQLKSRDTNFSIVFF